MQKLFEAALGIKSPWYVKTIDFDVAQKRLRIDVDFEAGSSFEDESEGSDGCAYKAYDTVRKEWRHLNFFEHECFLSMKQL